MVKNKWKMCLRTIVVLMCMFFLVEAGRFKKPGLKHSKHYSHIRRNTSSNFGLWPSPFNLATKAIISANGTCGENGREEFCRMVEGGKGRCGICDNFGTDPGKKHPITYAIDGSNKWWQSPALYYGAKYEYITITIDLKQVYQITDVIIKAANSLRPGTWILERSLNDEDYEAWQYFARNDKECFERFGIPSTKGKPHYFTDSEVICTSFYSKLTPMENGEIHTSLINGRPGVNETSPELLQFTKARYVRLRLMGLRGAVEPLPRWLSQDVLKEKRLFYTIRDISIIGYCVCNGHAENCRHNVASGHPECECAHHTCGPNCDKCCPMFNQRSWGPGSSRDSHQCLPCNCHGHATSCHYDENVDKAGLSMDINGNYQGGGVCDNCTAHTTGVNCERCLDGFYRPYGTEMQDEEPCVKCDCDTPGSLGSCVQEGLEAGTCECLPGYEGKKCEDCAPGFRGWPQCEACPCEAKGILEMPDCEGECSCKANVEGKFCNKCKPGYFSLKSSNPEGCIKCYCSEVTTLCESAKVTPKTIQTLDNWLITDSKISEVAKPIWDSKGLFSIGNYELSNTDTVYWLAPRAYLNNKLEYYGSVLTFKVHWVIMRGDTSGKPTTGPNVIIVGGNGDKIAQGNDFYSTSNETFNIKMKEDNWYRISYDISGKIRQSGGPPVSRRQFLGVLSNVSHILLRATFHTDQIESLLEEATLHSHEDWSNEVEKCSCPSGYSGLSCESCAFGYVKITTNSTSGESYCGKCDCNGHSETCNPDTGECFCQHSTTGENCERCKPGFYGNPLKGTKKDCRKCACPLENDENNFSPSCQLDYLNEDGEHENGYVCTQCPKGYTGDHCEICDDGYFGNPKEIGNVCQPCNCNGGPCDKITGQCLSCKGNTEGWRCEKCKVGYYGNALMSNCISCQCDSIGATSIACDLETGQCDCKERFTGRTCNKCEIGYGNVTALCTPCACNETGSKSMVCDQHTGLCECKDGVDGFHCDTCLNLHYGFSETGCKDCACDSHGSKIPACNQKGKCICKPHHVGSKCERCEDGYYKSNYECIPCECNSDGSATSNCDPETGNCFCKPGVQGRKCDSCKDKHYGNVSTGCKACDPCEKEGYICDPQNGKCDCPKLTEGPKCERCVAGAWGHEPGIGCKPCGCSRVGSSTPQCDSVTGGCTCKIGYENEKCENCTYGYYKYPNNPTCRKCMCEVSGTLREDCMNGTCRCSHEGCRCKANVEGQTCGQCKEGTFGLHADNPSGCISCFCSNRTTKCNATNYVWEQITTSDVRNISFKDCVTNCWSLPEKFTGDLMQSYGGYLRIGPGSRNVYLSGNKITLEAVTDARGYIKLTEIFWQVKKPNLLTFPKHCFSEKLSRLCLMTVLQNVTAIHIKSNSPNIKFQDVMLQKISDKTESSQGKPVESCTCPKEYTSSSCQDPNEGYYRHLPKQSEPQYSDIDRIFGVAKPCNCNNRSKSCDKETGHCVNCEGFTTGPHCNFCAKGYYKDHKGNCSPCKCPSEQQNFADSCTVEGNPPVFTCKCKSGYSGSSCNQCAEKYWGNPQEPGGSCQPCNCNPYGSAGLHCNKLTGQCQCKVGFTGKQCSRCSSPREVIQNGVCSACDECTQILFHTLDGLSDDVDKTLDLFKNGLGPPWRLLNSTMHNYTVLTKHFDSLQRAEDIVKNADIPNLKKKVQTMNKSLEVEKEILTKQLESIDNIFNITINKSKDVQNFDKKINDIIKSIGGYGKSHIDVKEALREAEELLNDIVMISQEAPSTREYQHFFNKCDKFNKAVNDIYKDDFNATLVETGLRDLENRMTQLNEELDRTRKITDLARSKNKRNLDRISSLNRTINELNQKNSIINENISSHLEKMSATNALLEDLKRIYEVLSSIDLEEIDLDNNDLEETYEALAAVREHVDELKRKIKFYKDIFNFTPDEWTKIDASGAYDSIVKGIERARNEAEQARNITRNALNRLYPKNDDSLTDKTNLAKAFSDRIQKRVQNLKNLTHDFEKTSRELEDLKQNILKNGKGNNELNSFLRSMLKNITQQSETVEKLHEAKARARNVSRIIESIDRKLKDTNITIEYELNKNYQKYLNLLSSSEITNLETKINQTKYQLYNITIPIVNTTYLDQIINANKNSTKAKLEMVEKMIQNLTKSIQNANDHVNAVDYAVNIAECQRSYDLKNDVFRSLEIEFKCDRCSLFSLTNSKNEIIKVEYQDPNVIVFWNKERKDIRGKNAVSIIRLGSLISIKTANDTATIQTDHPFEIDANHLLEIGNSNKTNATEACLRKIRLNGRTIGLWKFNTTKGNCSGCSRTSGNNNAFDKVFLNGNGYREVTLIPKHMKAKELTIRFTFETFDENSLIFLAHRNTPACSYIALNLKDGYLELNVKHNNGVNVTLRSDERYNTGGETIVELSMSYDQRSQNQNYLLRPPSSEAKSYSRPLEKKNVYPVRQSKLFIGGVSSTHDASCIPINTTSFLGNLYVVTVSNQNSLSVNAELPIENLRLPKAWFPGNGFIELESNYTDNITSETKLFFTFKPVSTINNFIININNNTDVYLENSNLVVKTRNGTEVQCDDITPNSFHFVTLSSDSVRVDDCSKNFSEKVQILHPKNHFRLGNSTSENYLSYVGSIGDIFIENNPILFTESTVKSFKNVEIGRDRVLAIKDSTKGMQNTERYLSIPDYRTEPQAFKFGDKPNSFVFTKNTVVGKKFIMEFQFRTFYPNGLLFLSNSQTANKNTFYTILEIQGGDIRLQVQGHKPKMMKMNKKINDGVWHHVQVEQILGKKKWRLIVKVDKKWKVKERGPRSNFNGDLYLGGVPNVLPVHKKIKNELHPFRGCIRSLRINKNPQVVKNNNIGQCFQNVEEGAYFGGDAFAIYKYDFKVDKLLELSFEFKTREPNGILLSVSNVGNSPALSVELQNGAVVMTIDMGNGIISQVTNSPHSESTLANNEWHNITALYSSFELTVNVDGVRKSWVQSDFNSMMDEIEAPLYVGGLPSNVPSGTLKIKENFKGCIRKFKIEDNIMDWTDMKKLNNVQLNSCLA